MTPERKSQILSVLPNYRALYYGQKVFTNDYQQKNYYEPLTRVGGDHLDCCNTPGYLSLRSVSDLTEEEYGHIGSMFSNYRSGDLKDIGKSIVFNMVEMGLSGFGFQMALMLADYLRSISIALPYYSITTGQITKDEWVEVGAIQIRK